MNKKTMVAAIFTMLLGACGGGGDNGGSNASAQPLSVPLQTAVANEVNNGISIKFAISGTVGSASVSGSGTLTDDKAAAATLNGASVLKTTETLSGTVTANNSSSPFSATRIIYRNPATFAEVAEDLGGQYVVFPTYMYPANVKAGDAASLVTATSFTSSDRTTKTGTVNLSYSVAADTASSLLVTFIESDFDNNNVKSADAKTTFRVDTAGNIQFISLKVTNFAINGQQGSLTFQ